MTDAAATLERHFGKIGARVRVRTFEPVRPRSVQRVARSAADRAAGAAATGGRRMISGHIADRHVRGVTRGEPIVDVVRDRRGEIFDITLDPGTSAEILSSDAPDRHLLLMLRRLDGSKMKFLCGHDERHWFAAAIPETRPAGTVAQAKAALQPAEVTAKAEGERRSERFARRNKAHPRQGEWFFLPSDDHAPDPKTILRDEPITRGRGKPHVAQFLHRSGGETVYSGGVGWTGPRGGTRGTNRTLTQTEWNALSEADRKLPWRVMRRDAEVFVKGRITHPDHATLLLQGWHRVLPNTEQAAQAMRFLAFLD